jgi:deoxyadenosine/deoxycytidine kinase
MDSAKYIAVEGPIGVGKTSFAKLLANELDGVTLLEEADDNPFLQRFYRDIKKYAFQTQLFFLLSRYQQQKALTQQDLFQKTVISDYIFAKDKIFAYLNLDEDELGLYEQTFRLLDERIPKPDLVIYLCASRDVLLDRIDKRNNDFEKNIAREYVEKLIQAYNKYFFYYNDSALLVVDTTDIDFVNNPADLSNLIKEIKSIRGGTHHYIPLGSRA